MMRRCILLFSFFNIISLTNEGFVTKWKRRKEECRIKMEHVLEQRAIRSLQECLAVCKEMPDCESVSRSSYGNDCLFSGINTVDDVRTEYAKWELEADWVTCSLVKYPVARVFNPDPNEEYLTFGEAADACADHHVPLASMDDLLLAATLGMNRCACGWISNGESRMPIPDSGICSSFPNVTGPAVVICSNANVIAWCKLN